MLYAWNEQYYVSEKTKTKIKNCIRTRNHYPLPEKWNGMGKMKISYPHLSYRIKILP